MKTNKWLKFKDDFFNTLSVKKLRKIAGGDTYLIIYQKLMLLTINTEGHYQYQEQLNTIEEELAMLLDEDVENVKMALVFCKSNKLIDAVDDNVIFLNQVPLLIGTNNSSTQRVREFRERKKLENNTQDNEDVTLHVTPVTECNAPREREREREDKDKDKDIDKDIDKTNKKDFVMDCLREYKTYVKTKYNKIIINDKSLINNLIKILTKYTLEDLILVTDFVMTNTYYIDNGYNTLSTIAKPTMFFGKLERARLKTTSNTSKNSLLDLGKSNLTDYSKLEF